MEKHMAVCPYCGAGCKLNLLVDDGQVIGAEGLDGVTNEGELCLKGLSGFDFINDTKILTPRILHPMIRREKGGELERVTWDEALDFTAKKLMAIKEKYGAESVIFAQGTGRDIAAYITRLSWSFGSPNYTGLLSGQACYLPRIAGMAATTGAPWIPDAAQQFPERYDHPD